MVLEDSTATKLSSEHARVMVSVGSLEGISAIVWLLEKHYWELLPFPSADTINDHAFPGHDILYSTQWDMARIVNFLLGIVATLGEAEVWQEEKVVNLAACD